MNLRWTPRGLTGGTTGSTSRSLKLSDGLRKNILNHCSSTLSTAITLMKSPQTKPSSAKPEDTVSDIDIVVKNVNCSDLELE